MNWRNLSYWVAIAASTIFLLGALGLMGIVLIQYVDWKMHLGQGYAPPLISMIGVLVAAVGTFAGVFFGWRNDRRQAKEVSVKNQEMELRIQEFEAKLSE